ncbi:MAG: antA/AntB antirepressor family protein [Zoogloeaceae bacterium]|nr:antA/AntB antirepressor family protein [Zoogloeaceae bacterium]
MNTLIAINPATIGGETVQTVNARELHAFLEVKKDFSDWIKAQLELFVQGVDYAVFNHNEYANIFPQKGENSQPCEARGRKPVEYALTIECAKHISMMSRTEKGKQARNYFIACERQVKAGVSSLPKNLTEALRLAADLNEQKELAEARALEAERTKAWIGSNREATAMATASAAVREKKRLEIELDHSKEYATVKRMEMLYHGQKFNWRLLKSTAIEMGIPSMDIFDQNYGTVKAYHADVWREAYALEIPAAPSNDDLAENAA